MGTGRRTIRSTGRGGLTYDGTYLWSNAGPQFIRIDPDTHEWELVFVYEDIYEYFPGLAWVNGSIWGLSSGTMKLIELNPNDGSVIKKLSIPTDDPGLQEPRGLAWDGEAFWVNDYKSQRFYRLDPKDGHILGYVENAGDQPLPWGLAFGVGPTTPPDK